MRFFPAAQEKRPVNNRASEVNPDGFLAIDFETAAPQRASACAVGWALVGGGTIIQAGSTLIDPKIPEDEWSPWCIAVHGIRPKDVKGAPKFAEAWSTITRVAEGRPLVAHYAPFDTSVVRMEAVRNEVPLIPFKYACSARLARSAWPELESVSLPVVARWLGIELRHHDPKSDAEASAMVALRAMDQLGAESLDIALKNVALFWGEISATGERASFASRRSSAADFEALGLKPGANPDHPFFGQVVVFTGPLASMPRADAKRHVFEAGGVPASSVTRATNFLVVATMPSPRVKEGGDSTKLKKAKELRRSGQDIQVIDEDDFLRLLLD